jgi:hypothetical protein
MLCRLVILFNGAGAATLGDSGISAWIFIEMVGKDPGTLMLLLN